MEAPILTIHLSADEKRSLLGGMLKGVPAGTVIPKGYLSHQIWRMRRRVDISARTTTGEDIVGIAAGLQRRTTTGAPIAFAIGSRALGPRSRKPVHPDVPWTLRSLAIPITSLTVVRKMLEDRSIFVGSRVCAPWEHERGLNPEIVESRITGLLSASCGAYKITEQADRSLGRILRPDPSLNSSASPWVFELLISGPPGWAGGTPKGRSALAARFASQILALSPVASVSADVSEMKGIAVTTLRLRTVLRRPRTSRNPESGRAGVLSVLAETMIIPPLAHSVMGLSLVGLSSFGASHGA